MSWKKSDVQKKTFTNWFNDRLRGNLKSSKVKVDDLYEDLKDGLLLISLCEQLAKPRKLPRYNKRVVNKIQAIENLGFVLKFCASENIKLVNIGPEDLYDGNPKLILGLVWTLIGRYQIRSSGRGLSTKAALKEWLDTLIPEYGIQNFNTDWNDGRPLCGLVDRLQPGVCPNHMALNPNDKLENCEMGMSLAEDCLDIPRVIDPEDMINPNVDDLSVMTYISYFFTPAMAQLLEWIQKKIPHRNITNLSTDWNTGVSLAALIEACHTGLFPDWKDLDPHNALENLEKCIKTANERLDIKCPVGAKELSDPKVDEIIVATYLSRFKYSKLLASANEVVLNLPVLKSGCGIVNQPVELKIELGSTPLATMSQLVLKVTGPSGSKIPATMEKPTGSFTVASFVPRQSGKFNVSCSLNDEEVTGSPMTVPVIDPNTWTLSINIPETVQVNKPITAQLKGEPHGGTPVVTCESFINDGKELYTEETLPHTSSVAAVTSEPSQQDLNEPSVVSGLDKPAVVGEEFNFSVAADNIEDLDVSIEGPAISYTPEIEKSDTDSGKCLVNFIPEEVGNHTVDIAIGDDPVKNSPFTLSVVAERPEEEEKEEEASENKNENEEDAEGKNEDNAGEDKAEADKANENPPKKAEEKAEFIQSSISPFENGKCNIYILPTDVGKVKTHVTIGGVDVANSPFKYTVVDTSKCSMSDLENKTFLSGQEVNFSVNVGKSDLEPVVSIQGPHRAYTPKVGIDKNADDEKEYQYGFTPIGPGVVKIVVKLGGEHIPGSPCTIQVSEPGIISEIPKYLEVGTVYNFDVLVDYSLEQTPTVLTTDANNIPTSIMSGSIIKNESLSNHWKLELKPLDPGTATVHVKLGNYQIKKSPFSVKISALSQCKVEGMENEMLLGESFVFKVVLDEGLTETPEVKVHTPGSQALLSGVDNGDNSYTYSYLPIALGVVKFAVLFKGQEIPGSPFSKEVGSPSDAKQCVAYGGALEPNAVLQTNKPLEFSVDCKKAGKGELQVIAQGPKKHRPKVLIAEEDDVYTLRIDAVRPGTYHVHVWWSQVHIPNSPFHLKVHQVTDPTKVRAYGSGVSGEIEAGRPAEFYILTRDAGMGTLTVIVYGVKDAFKVDVKPEDPSDPRTLKGVYYPKEAGEYKVIIKWSGMDIPGSPFPVNVTDRQLEIERARSEERRKERIKRVEAQQKIIRQQNVAMKKAIQSMPNFAKTQTLSMGKGGQFASASFGAKETTTQKIVHKQKRRYVRNFSANAILQKSESQPQIGIGGAKEKRKRKVTAPAITSTPSFESAMQRNAGFLGVKAPIGGSLKGGVNPLWQKFNVPAPKQRQTDENSTATPHLSTAPVLDFDESKDFPDEVPISIEPMYDNDD